MVQAGDDESLDTVRRKIAEHRRVQAALSEQRPALQQAAERGRQLLSGVTCAALDADVTDFSEQLVRINNDNASELKRSGLFCGHNVPSDVACCDSLCVSIAGTAQTGHNAFRQTLVCKELLAKENRERIGH